MKTIKGPAIFLAQFLKDSPPYHDLESISGWAASLGYKGIQIPTWDRRIFDLEQASQSKGYCEDYKGKLKEKGLEVVELASYLQGQVMAIHPAYELLFQPFYPKGLDDPGRLEWASEQLRQTILASAYFGTENISVLSGGLAWPYIYPWPQRSKGLVDEAFGELARRWLPLFDRGKEYGITFGFELHPGSDLYDGATFLRFLDKVSHHPAACITYDASHFLLQQMDYVEFIRIFHDRIKAFHVKDAEFITNGLTGVYGGYHDWVNRAGRFRSPGDGQVDFKKIFTELTTRRYEGWAILEWECCVKSPEQGAKEGALFIASHIIEATQYVFDDFASSPTDHGMNKQILGLDR
ncbi:sugar phosphate isomerase/epimerase family protein [Negadavirga shengliensis]|uniref:Sugar phosphate isomerase/epimerase family protein n=1 Tax=Negadavirga shengliensis TaxID=1389218 RepID=A0ABV9T3A0_9BACT